MHISERGLTLIEEFEGGRSADGLFHAYLDTVAQPHIWTIGFGQTHNVHQGMTWTLRQALDDLARTLAQDGYEAAVNGLGVSLNQNQFDALCSFVYNVGPGGVAASTTVGRELRARNWRAAADALLAWDVAGGVHVPGLLRRRQAERVLFLTPFAASDPDARYRLFDNRKRSIIRGRTERDVVKRYDVLRAMQTKTKHPHRVELALLRVQLGVLERRLENVLKRQTGKISPDLSWRLKELRARRQGKRQV